MDALLFTLALEVALLQMRILEGSIELTASQVSHKKDKKLQINKLVRDRQMVKDVIRRTLIEITESDRWCTLQRAVDVLQQRVSSFVKIRSIHEHLKKSREEIADELKTKRNQYVSEHRNMDQKIAFLRDKIKDRLLNANTQLCYVEKWLCARAESLELRCQAQLAPAPRADHEQRVHNELLRAYELQIKERGDALEYWRIRYVDDTARINKRLAQKRDELSVAIARREKLQQLYNLHEGEIRAWLTFKQERAARLAHEECLRVAATRIQAWWRGVMVRRGLGAFRYLRQTKKTSSKSKKK